MPLSHMLRVFLLFGSLCAGASVGHAGTRLDAIRQHGQLVCGVATQDPGFALRLPDGTYQGLEIDLCRAVAAAVLGSSTQVRFAPLDTVHEFLADPRIDLVFHRLSWALTREAPGQLEFGPVYFLEAAASNRLEPLAPLLRSDDGDFSRIVRWAVYALLDAELYAVDRANAEQAGVRGQWPAGETGLALDLPPDWANRMVAQVGNYAEIYARNLGVNSKRPLPRGPNRLWRDGGLMVPLLLH